MAKTTKPKVEFTLYPKIENGEDHWYHNELSLGILKKKYLYENETSVKQFISRVASIFSTKELRNSVAQMMADGTFFPGGRSLYGIGSKGIFNATTSNCYIMPSPEDSLDSIYESNKQVAKIFKSGGGIGIDLSTLRPNGSKTNNAARTSTGAVSFMHIYNSTGSIIGFHGRRGATLIGLRVSHPDIEEFIDLRNDHDMKAMNISCIIDYDFMHAVTSNEDYLLHFTVEATGEKIEKTVNARKLFHHICEMNWDYGDPGMLFKDAVDGNNLQSMNSKFKIDICNPCAEYTGPAYNSCNLGSLNLYNFVDHKFSKNASFNFKEFRKAVHIAVSALDEILDYGYDLQPLDQNREIIDKWRAIGLGFFGFADALIALQIKYGTDESVEFALKVCECLMTSAIEQSSILAKEKSCFGEIDIPALLQSPFLEELKKTNKPIYEMVKKNGMRNAQLISIAPTGSLALLAGSLSSGIEPIYKCNYERTTHGLEDSKVHFTVADKAIKDLLRFHQIDPTSISANEIKARFPFVVEASDIDPMDRVEIQAAMQSCIDNAISSTVNLPEEATVEDIENIYLTAWKKGLKGITVFRNNCKRASILGFADKKENVNPEEPKLNVLEPIHRISKLVPLSGRTYRKRTACVKAMYVTVNRDENNNIFEVFTNKSTHGCSANIATITRLVSLALRTGIKVEKIIEELKENTCQACISVNKDHPDYNLSLSCPYAIAEALEQEYKLCQEGQANTTIIPQLVEDHMIQEGIESHDDENALMCPECHHKTLIPEGKCVTCKRCGYSKCD